MSDSRASFAFLIFFFDYSMILLVNMEKANCVSLRTTSPLRNNKVSPSFLSRRPSMGLPSTTAVVRRRWWVLFKLVGVIQAAHARTQYSAAIDAGIYRVNLLPPT